MNAWRAQLAAAVGLAPDDIIAIQGVGQPTDNPHPRFFAPQGVMGDLDLQTVPGKQTRASIMRELTEFLESSAF